MTCANCCKQANNPVIPNLLRHLLITIFVSAFLFSFNAKAQTYSPVVEGILTITITGNAQTIEATYGNNYDITEVIIVNSSYTYSIGNDVFRSCTSLVSVTLPEGLTTIGNDVFRSCTSLESVTLPEGLTTIGNNVFQSCTSLVSVTLPEGLTTIGSEVFRDCPKLESVTFLGDVPTTLASSTIFNDASSNFKIYYPFEYKDNYVSKFTTTGFPTAILSSLTPASGTYIDCFNCEAKTYTRYAIDDQPENCKARKDCQSQTNIKKVIVKDGGKLTISPKSATKYEEVDPPPPAP